MNTKKTQAKPKPISKFKNWSNVHVYNYRTQYSTERFWLFSFPTSQQSSLLVES